MAKVIRYNLTFLGTIELADFEENLTDSQIQSLIAEHYYDQGFDIEYANDIEYEVEEI
jgi:hypothetical protein